MEEDFWRRFVEAKEFVVELRNYGLDDEQIIEEILSWEIDRNSPKLRNYIICKRFLTDFGWTKILLR